MAGSGSWPELRGSGRPRCHWGPASWRPALSRWAGPASPAVAASALADLDPGLRPALLALVEPDERGDPMSPLRWTTKSLRALSGELTRRGHRAGAGTVADLLREEGFSLQGNAKAVGATRSRTGTGSSVTSTSGSGSTVMPASR
jgi:Rhodopirellula transposase DDE domain